MTLTAGHLRSYLKTYGLKFLLFALIIFIVIKAYRSGYDANVYLHASQQFFNGDNPYANNPYNDYLYSPLFAAILGPLSLLDFSIARVILALLNTLVAYRLWMITKKTLISKFKVPRTIFSFWAACVAVISAGFIIHNLNLGQINVLILWLTLEGLHQIMIKNKQWTGAGLIALGINIKIIPVIALYYLFFKGKFKSLILTGIFLVISLLLPAIVHGFSHNLNLLQLWKDKINPSGEKYMFENNNRCNSLNAILPAYFHDFKEQGEDDKFDLPRVVLNVPQEQLAVVLQSLRVLLALSVLLLIFYRRRNRANPSLYFFWEFSYLMLVSFLVFPHQMKYALVCTLPAAAYLIIFAIYALKNKSSATKKERIIAYSSLIILFVTALMGRDILGNHLINLLDYYHALGINTIILMLMLPLVKPDKLTAIIHHHNRDIKN